MYVRNDTALGDDDVAEKLAELLVVSKDTTRCPISDDMV